MLIFLTLALLASLIPNGTCAVFSQSSSLEDVGKLTENFKEIRDSTKEIMKLSGKSVEAVTKITKAGSAFLTAVPAIGALFSIVSIFLGDENSNEKLMEKMNEMSIKLDTISHQINDGFDKMGKKIEWSVNESEIRNWFSSLDTTVTNLVNLQNVISTYENLTNNSMAVKSDKKATKQDKKLAIEQLLSYQKNELQRACIGPDGTNAAMKLITKFNEDMVETDNQFIRDRWVKYKTSIKYSTVALSNDLKKVVIVLLKAITTASKCAAIEGLDDDEMKKILKKNMTLYQEKKMDLVGNTISTYQIQSQKIINVWEKLYNDLVQDGLKLGIDQVFDGIDLQKDPENENLETHVEQIKWKLENFWGDLYDYQVSVQKYLMKSDFYYKQVYSRNNDFKSPGGLYFKKGHFKIYFIQYRKSSSPMQPIKNEIMSAIDMNWFSNVTQKYYSSSVGLFYDSPFFNLVTPPTDKIYSFFIQSLEPAWLDSDFSLVSGTTNSTTFDVGGPFYIYCIRHNVVFGDGSEKCSKDFTHSSELNTEQVSYRILLG